MGLRQQRVTSQKSLWAGLEGVGGLEHLDSRAFGNVRSNTVLILLKCGTYKAGLAGLWIQRHHCPHAISRTDVASAGLVWEVCAWWVSGNLCALCVIAM